MDAELKLLADASLEVAAAEEALSDGAHQTARDRLDAAGEVLAALRERWPGMDSASRTVVGPAARDVRGRLDAATARLPRRSALVDVPAEADPEQEIEPEAA
jgi:hypothetical protein